MPWSFVPQVVLIERVIEIEPGNSRVESAELVVQRAQKAENLICKNIARRL